jgi:tetratricopeptide (TPR) repeat protein
MRLRSLVVAAIVSLASLVFPPFLLHCSLATTVSSPAAESAPEDQAAQLMVQGILQMQRSQYQEALRSLQAALKQYQTLNNRQGQLIVLNSLASAHFYLGQYRQPIAISQQAIELMQAFDQSATLKPMQMLIS